VTSIRATITRFVDDYQPGIVECRFVDAHGVEHVFVLKTPFVTSEWLGADSTYPLPGSIACHIIGSGETVRGKRVVTVDTTEPDAVESLAGISRFEVFADQLTEERTV
jgi:hypothetical protein